MQLQKRAAVWVNKHKSSVKCFLHEKWEHLVAKTITFEF